MNNNEVLSKLTLGKNETEKVKINYENEDYELELRPLTSGELSKLQVIEKKSMTLKIGMQNGKRTSTNINDMDINTGEFTKDQTDSMYAAIAWSLDVEEETVKELPAGLPELIFKEVVRVSKLSKNDLTIIKSFHED